MDQSFAAHRSLICSPVSEPVARGGLSLARNGLCFSQIPFRGHCSRPAASLPTHPLTGPFGFPLRAGCGLPRFQPLLRVCPLPACWRLGSTPKTASTPRRGRLHPYRIKVFCRSGFDRLAFRIRPIAVRSPDPPSISSCGSGSSFPIRYVSGGLLLSRRPSGLRKTRRESNSLAHRTTWLRSDFWL